VCADVQAATAAPVETAKPAPPEEMDELANWQNFAPSKTALTDANSVKYEKALQLLRAETISPFSYFVALAATSEQRDKHALAIDFSNHGDKEVNGALSLTLSSCLRTN
jgi:hypothetical protein